MNGLPLQRKLVALLRADAVGHTRLMERDEERTLRTLAAHRAAIEELVTAHRGRVVDTAGDGLLAELPSAVDAVRCAVAVQRELSGRNAQLPASERLAFRLGLNVGDVIEEDGRLYGDGVNVASRIEGLAGPGEIWLSASVQHHVAGKADLRLEDMGTRSLKNLTRAVHVYRVADTAGEKARPAAAFRHGPVVAAALLTFALLALGLWKLVAQPWMEANDGEVVSLAVLPFENLSENKEMEHFGDGLADDLITDLSKISNLFVIARNSAFTYKGRSMRVEEIAQELGTRYVLEGSVREENGAIRINAQLIDATTGGHIWAERFDATEDKMLAVQDRINHQILRALALRLSPEEERRLGEADADNADAHLEFRKGWAHFVRRTEDDYGEALSHYQRALEIDPDYGQAEAALALLYWRAAGYGLAKKMGVSYAAGRVRATHHLELARQHPTALYHAAASEIHLALRQYDQAISEAALAVALQPGNAYYNELLAKMICQGGNDPAEALRLVDTALRLDPLNPATYLGTRAVALLRLGRAAEALTDAQRVLTLNPELRSYASVLAVAYVFNGNLEEARNALWQYEKNWTKPTDLEKVTYFLNFRDRPFMAKFAGALVQAGLEDTGYLDTADANRLAGPELEDLISQGAVVGFNRKRPWQIQVGPDGTATWTGYDPAQDTGRVWVEGDLLCEQWSTRWEGLKHCRAVFRNPKGTAGQRNQYISYTPVFYYPFSMADLSKDQGALPAGQGHDP